MLACRNVLWIGLVLGATTLLQAEDLDPMPFGNPSGFQPKSDPPAERPLNEVPRDEHPAPDTGPKVWKLIPFELGQGAEIGNPPEQPKVWKLIPFELDPGSVPGSQPGDPKFQPKVWRLVPEDEGEPSPEDPQGKLPRFHLGVLLDELPELVRSQLKLESGIVVKEVQKDSPADQAGLREHDILLAVDELALTTPEQLIDAVQKAGTTPMKLILMREGNRQTVTLTPADRETPPGDQRVQQLESRVRELEQRVEELTRLLSRQPIDPAPEFVPSPLPNPELGEPESIEPQPPANPLLKPEPKLPSQPSDPGNPFEIVPQGQGESAPVE